MKIIKQSFLVITLLVAFGLKASEGNSDKYYYYQNKKIYLQEKKDNILLRLSQRIDKEFFISKIQMNPNYELAFPEDELNEFVVLKNLNERNVNLEDLVSDNDVISAKFMLSYENNSLQGYFDEFVVKLKEPYSIFELESFAEQHHVLQIKENQFEENKFTIRIDKNSVNDIIELANLFHESGLFEYSEPNFFRSKIFHVNDPFYNNQWSIKPNGISGTDMDIQEVWEITKGSDDIKIAIVDEGVDLNHPDLINNLLSGYDATGNGSAGAPNSNEPHGTACAGIIAAEQNNSIGVTGIAPNCKIIPTRVSFNSSSTDNWLANSINWSYQNDADIISNSWSGGPPSNSITTAISNATTLGRDGLGSIVVFSTGNNNSNVNYPATLSNVIAVGATTIGDARASYSNYGGPLDVVAPGGNSNIYTTDLIGANGYSSTNYTSGFEGTSAACPHVSGVVALMLSVNKCLTWNDTKKLLELSCDKVGGYSYKSYYCNNQPNGTWNNEMGHGRVNAYRAVSYAHSENNYLYTNVGGTSGPGTGFYAMNFTNTGCISVASGQYFVTQYEVQTTITFPYTENPTINAASDGFSSASPNNSQYWVGVSNVTNTSVKLNTYVYETQNILGQTIGWVPRQPGNVRFKLSIVNAADDILYLQNKTESSVSKNYVAKTEVSIGKFVDPNTTYADYVVNGSSNVSVRAGNKVYMKEGTRIVPSSGGRFYAVVGKSVFTCSQYPYGRKKSPTQQTAKTPYSKSFDLSKSIEESDLARNITLYPNPTNHSLTIDMNTSINQVKVLSLDGKILMDQEGNGVQSTLDLSSLSNGIYFIEVHSEGNVYQEKVIKQ